MRHSSRYALPQLTYSNKDQLVAGDATVAIRRGQKANLLFNQQKLLTAKYSYLKVCVWGGGEGGMTCTSGTGEGAAMA
jgi:hypothetical protein